MQIKKAFSSLFLAGTSLLAGPPIPILTTLGEWPLCANGTLSPSQCQWYIPGDETYMVMVQSSPNVVEYKYEINAVLEDGKQVFQTGTIQNNPSEYGYANSQPIMFGGIVETFKISMTETVTTTQRRQR